MSDPKDIYYTTYDIYYTTYLLYDTVEYFFSCTERYYMTNSWDNAIWHYRFTIRHTKWHYREYVLRICAGYEIWALECYLIFFFYSKYFFENLCLVWDLSPCLPPRFHIHWHHLLCVCSSNFRFGFWSWKSTQVSHPLASRFFPLLFALEIFYFQSWSLNFRSRLSNPVFDPLTPLAFICIVDFKFF